jgi:hypothetical protein
MDLSFPLLLWIVIGLIIACGAAFIANWKTSRRNSPR